MRSARRSNRYVASLGALLLVDGALALAAEGDDAIDRTPQDCVSLPRVARTEIIDDQNVLFHIRGKKIYLNHLPRKCPNLARQNRFMYKTVTTRLCSTDMITVLEQWGARFTPGFTCRLGAFVPVTADEVEDLRAAAGQEGGRRRVIRSEAVELPPEQNGADGEKSEAPAESPPADPDPD